MSPLYEAVPARRELTVVSADGTRIHVEEFGQSDSPTVVLSHGWTCSILFWAPVVRTLAADFRVIAYDQRGHGRSDAPLTRTGYGTGALADDLQAVMEAMVPAGQRVVLAGHSMGGMTIMAASGRVAVRDRTAAVLLASTGSGRLLGATQVLPPRFGPRGLRRALHRRLLASRMPLGPVTPLSRAALKYGVLAAGATREQVDFTARIVHACRARQRSAWGKVLAVLDLDAELVALTVPTAVLVGTADKLTPQVHARGMADTLPHCSGLTELPGIGHMTPIEDAPGVAHAIRRLAADYLTADDPTNEGHSSDERNSHRPTSHQPTSDHPTSHYPTSGHPTSDSPMFDSPTSGMPPVGHLPTVRPTSDRPTSGHHISGHHISGHHISGQRTSERRPSDHLTSDEPTSDGPVSDEPTSDRPTSDRPTSADPTWDKPTSDQPTSDNPTFGSPHAAEEKSA